MMPIEMTRPALPHRSNSPVKPALKSAQVSVRFEGDSRPKSENPSVKASKKSSVSLMGRMMLAMAALVGGAAVTAPSLAQQPSKIEQLPLANNTQSPNIDQLPLNGKPQTPKNALLAVNLPSGMKTETLNAVLDKADTHTYEYNPVGQDILKPGTDKRLTTKELNSFIVNLNNLPQEREAAKFLLKHFDRLAEEHSFQGTKAPPGMPQYLKSFIEKADIEKVAAFDAEPGDLSGADLERNYAFEVDSVLAVLRKADTHTHDFRQDAMEGKDGRVTKNELNAFLARKDLKPTERKIAHNLVKHFDRIAYEHRYVRDIPPQGFREWLKSFIQPFDFRAVSAFDGDSETVSYVDLSKAMLSEDVQDVLKQADQKTLSILKSNDKPGEQTLVETPGADKRVTREELKAFLNKSALNPLQKHIASQLLNADNFSRLTQEHLPRGGANPPKELLAFQAAFIQASDVESLSKKDRHADDVSAADLASSKDNGPPRPIVDPGKNN